MEAASETGGQWHPNRVWLFIAAFFALALVTEGYGQWSNKRRYNWEGRQAEGHIVAVTPHDHNSISVAYQVEGKNYSRKGSASPRSADDYCRGDKFWVYYFASDPVESFLREPQFAPLDLVFGWVLVVAGSRVLIAVVSRAKGLPG